MHLDYDKEQMLVQARKQAINCRDGLCLPYPQANTALAAARAAEVAALLNLILADTDKAQIYETYCDDTPEEEILDLNKPPAPLSSDTSF